MSPFRFLNVFIGNGRDVIDLSKELHLNEFITFRSLTYNVIQNKYANILPI